MDSEQQAGTGSDNKSVVEKEISCKSKKKKCTQQRSMTELVMSSFADTAVVKYNASDELTSYDAEASAVQMGAFMRKMAKFLEISDLTRVLAYANERKIICAMVSKS